MSWTACDAGLRCGELQAVGWEHRRRRRDQGDQHLHGPFVLAFHLDRYGHLPPDALVENTAKLDTPIPRAPGPQGRSYEA